MSVIAKCNQCGDKRKIDKHRSLCYHCRKLNHQIKTGEVLDKDYEDTTYAPYKDPMVPNDTGFGYVGAIVQSKNGSHIQCNICGYFFRSLGSHVNSYHKIKPRDYKIKYGLRVTKGLYSPQQLQKRQKTFNEHPIRKAAAKNAVKAREALKKKREEGQKTYNADDSWIPQLRNERGQCADQLLEKIKQLTHKLGRVPYHYEFEKYYSTGAMHSLKTLHGSWDKAVKKAGLKTFKARRTLAKMDRADDVIDRMIEWYEKHERTPQRADFRDSDDLPTARQVELYFGGLNKAREAAGIPQIKNVGGKWVEVNEYF